MQMHFVTTMPLRGVSASCFVHAGRICARECLHDFGCPYGDKQPTGNMHQDVFNPTRSPVQIEILMHLWLIIPALTYGKTTYWTDCGAVYGDAPGYAPESGCDSGAGEGVGEGWRQWCFYLRDHGRRVVADDG